MADKLKSSKVDQLRHGLKVKLTHYTHVAKNPSLFISYYFDAIRYDIDIATEVLLMTMDEKADQEESAEKKDETYHLDWCDKRKLLPYTDEEKPEINNPDQVNTMRDLMVSELKKLEQSWLKNVEVLNEIRNFHDNDKSSVYEAEIGNAFLKNAGASDDESFKALQIECESLHTRLDMDTDNLKRALLMNRTVFFRKGVLNELGILVIFSGSYLKDAEVDFLK